MTPSVYIVGGAGTGKSTFTQALLTRLGAAMGPLEEIHTKKIGRNQVVLRGHRLADGGLYIGLMRDSFPGTDGLDRVSSPVGVEWLAEGPLPEYIVSEGATLATRPFITALHQHTNLLLVHLLADDFVKELRFLERGSNQDEKFVKATATRSANLFNDITGCWKIQIDTAHPGSWDTALGECVDHLASRA